MSGVILHSDMPTDPSLYGVEINDTDKSIKIGNIVLNKNRDDVYVPVLMQTPLLNVSIMYSDDTAKRLQTGAYDGISITKVPYTRYEVKKKNGEPVTDEERKQAYDKYSAKVDHFFDVLDAIDEAVANELNHAIEYGTPYVQVPVSKQVATKSSKAKGGQHQAAEVIKQPDPKDDEPLLSSYTLKIPLDKLKSLKLTKRCNVNTYVNKDNIQVSERQAICKCYYYSNNETGKVESGRKYINNVMVNNLHTKEHFHAAGLDRFTAKMILRSTVSIGGSGAGIFAIAHRVKQMNIIQSTVPYRSVNNSYCFKKEDDDDESEKEAADENPRDAKAIMDSISKKREAALSVHQTDNDLDDTNVADVEDDANALENDDEPIEVGDVQPKSKAKTSRPKVNVEGNASDASDVE